MAKVALAPSEGLSAYYQAKIEQMELQVRSVPRPRGRRGASRTARIAPREIRERI